MSRLVSSAFHIPGHRNLKFDPEVSRMHGPPCGSKFSCGPEEMAFSRLRKSVLVAQQIKDARYGRRGKLAEC